jgi:hypothetical protein
MRLDSMLGFLVLLGLSSLGGCVVPESVGDHDSDTPSDSETGEPLECFGLPDEASCLAAGCSHFETVLQVSDTCECTQSVPACLQFTDGIGGSDSPDYFWHEATGTVMMFDTSWAELPVGWRRCTEAGAPPACECYEPFMGPMCP